MLFTRIYKSLLIAALFLPVYSNAADTLIVSAKGNGTYLSVQDAVNHIPAYNKKRLVIFIRNGLYHEKLIIDSTKTNIKLVGESADSVIISYNDHAGKVNFPNDTINTRNSYSVLICPFGFIAENISFSNDAGYTAGQAVAAEVRSDHSIFIHCRFTGFQDVLFLNADQSHQYYKDCTIEGTTDFIFGSATCYFEHCFIYCKKNSHITAASTPAKSIYGFVFHDCSIKGDSSLHQVSLGRPWRPFAKVAYIDCYMDAILRPEGWSVWNKTDHHLTSYFAEYHSYGPGANDWERLNWCHILQECDVDHYSPEHVLGNWISQIQIP